jgi:Leu/Phe-tRNA-protein transferase
MKPKTVTLTPLDKEVRSALPNDEAAAHLGMQPQTMRLWACYGRGPIQPMRVGSRLRWKTADIRSLLGVAQ